MNHSEIVAFIWGVADLIRGKFKRGQYQDVILPLTVLRRIDCVLAPRKRKVLETRAKLKGKLENLDPQLRKASSYAFYNTSLYDFESLLGDPPHLAANLRHYINGFSPNMREVVEKFHFDGIVSQLEEHGLLFKVVERFKNVDLHPDHISNARMGTIFEELIRRFNEALDENPGEHFTPRDVVRLMVDLMLAGDEKQLRRPGAVLTVCDPCCGSGGMLTIAKEHIQGTNGQAGLNPEADVHLFGQESQPETFAICKSDLFMKSVDGRDADHIFFGSTLAHDPFDRSFDYQIANPPYGHEWKADEEDVRAEYEKGDRGRFGPGLPRISDGQLLFLEHMLFHMKAPKDGGGRIAIIMNGSPLFTGGAGSGESEIRRWMLENDLVEAIVALPTDLFYNTGIQTYVWLLTNRKPKDRQGKVQLIDASSERFWKSMRKSLGSKRREISDEARNEIVRMYQHMLNGEGTEDWSDYSKIFDVADFGYREIRVERPLRLSFQVNEVRIELLKSEKAFQKLDVDEQTGLLTALSQMPDTVYANRDAFEKALDKVLKAGGVRISTQIKKILISILSERDEHADVCTDKDGNPEPDTGLRDQELVPLKDDWRDYFTREVTPFVPNAWVDETLCDTQDGKVGRVGYEINFNRYFYKYVPPRPLEEIDAELKQLEAEITELLKGVVV